MASNQQKTDEIVSQNFHFNQTNDNSLEARIWKLEESSQNLKDRIFF